MRRMVTILLAVLNLALFTALTTTRSSAAESFTSALEDCCEGGVCCQQCCLSKNCTESRGC